MTVSKALSQENASALPAEHIMKILPHSSTLDTIRSTLVLKPSGKFIKIMMIQKKMKLCAVDLQDEDNKAPLSYIRTDGDKKAFLFSYRDNWYWMTVKANELHFVKEDEPFWFEVEDMGTSEYSGLRFKNQKTMWYLSTTSQQERLVLTFKQQSVDCAPITFESRN